MGLAPPDPLLAHPPTQALVLHPEQPTGLPEEAQGALQGCWGWVSDSGAPPHLDTGVGWSVGGGQTGLRTLRLDGQGTETTWVSACVCKVEQ